MTIEQIQKGNKLIDRLNECETYLQKIRYTQSENVVTRESHFKCNGIDGIVVIPKNLFRIIGKLIESEYIQEIDELKKELNEL